MNASDTRKYASDYEPSGYAARSVAKSTAHAGVTGAELVAVALEDLTDGDTDTRRAVRALARLGELCAHISETQWHVLDGDLRTAKQVARKLDEEGKTP